MFTTIRRDLARYYEGAALPRWRTTFESIVFKAGFHAVLLHRISHWLWRHGRVWLAWFVARANLALSGADIEFSARIGPGLLIAHPAGIVIGRGTVIGSDVTLFQGVTCGLRNWGDGRAYPRIGDRAILFARCSVLGGISIGNRAIVGAHALVTRDLPEGAVARAPAATIAA